MTPALSRRFAAPALVAPLGVLVLGLGLVAATGWMIGSSTMVRMVPGSVAMGFNTALGLIAGGIWILVRQEKSAAWRQFRIALALFMIILFGLILLQHIFGVDFGIDWRELHKRVPDRNRLPGRVAPNTSLALFICGSALLIRDLAFNSRLMIVRGLGWVVLTIGLSGLLGYLLNLEWLYQWYRLNRMALPTAIAVTLLGAAVTLDSHEPRQFRIRDADKVIVARSVATIALLAVMFMLSGFVVLRQGIEQLIRQNMLQTVEDDRVLLLSVFEQHARLVKLVASSPSLAEGVKSETGRRAGDPNAASSSLEKVRQRFLLLGFSRFDVYDSNGILLAGEPNTPALMRVALKAPGEAAEIVWRDGYLIANRVVLKHQANMLASVTLEQKMPSLFPNFSKAGAGGSSGEHRLCARAEERLLCFPSGPGTHALDLPLRYNNAPSFPVARALLNGEKGVVTATDYRGKPVLAAFVPIESGVLGLVFKQEIEEAFAPLRQRLAGLIGLVILLVAGSALILRSAVRPLATKLLQAETTAREQAAALRSSLKALNDTSSELQESERQVRALNTDLERRVAERTADLMRANDELRQFAYAASHDLQEPLRNIALFSQFIHRRYADKLDSGGAEYLHLMAQNAQRMQQLLRDVLEFAQAGDSAPGSAESDANAALDEALANLHATILESGTHVERGVLPTRVAVHHIHLVQVLQNLIGNSIKYRSAHAPRINVDARREQARWIFSVRDNGIGIEKPYIDQIFGMFRRLHKNEYPGTGIGLAICQKIVQRYDGEIWVESEVGLGTTFYFSLPAAAEPDQKSA